MKKTQEKPGDACLVPTRPILDRPCERILRGLFAIPFDHVVPRRGRRRLELAVAADVVVSVFCKKK